MYYVYILTNNRNTCFYIGVTNNLLRRVYEHKNKVIKGFTNKYNLSKLVYYEISVEAYSAIAREKQLKNWHREWKLNLIKKINPMLLDISNRLDEFRGDPETSSG